MYHIFTSRKTTNGKQLTETANHSEHQKKQHISSTQQKTDVSCLKQGAGDRSTEIKVEPHSLAPKLSPVTPPSCEREPPSADSQEEDEDEEDQTVFFTPELFEGEGDEGSPQKETKTKY